MGARLVETRYGPHLIPPRDAYVGRSLAENGVFSPDEFDGWRPYLPTGAVVLDVGANIGAHTMAFADAIGPAGVVIAVEPQRMLFAMLCGTQALQGRQNVWPRWCGLGAAAGILYVPPLDYDAENNFGGLPLDGMTSGDPVAQMTVDAWGLSRLDFMKIDVEGMELDVLHGAERTIAAFRPVLVIEADRQERYAAVLDWVLTRSYRPFLQTPLLGTQWPEVRSKNLLCVPIGYAMEGPPGPDIAGMPELEPLIGA